MKIDYINDNNYVVYINNLYYTFDKTNINILLNKILKRLKKIYDIQIYSTFNIECFIDNKYGIVLEIKREYDPFNLYSKKTDLNINYNYTNFLYEVDDYFINSNNKYIYNNKIYVDNYISEHIIKIIYKNIDRIKV